MSKNQPGNRTGFTFDGLGYNQKGALGKDKVIFSWPVESGRLTSAYGDYSYKLNGVVVYANHKGIDVGAPSGTSVNAAAPGKVIEVQQNTGSLGYAVVIDHGAGYKTTSAHLDGPPLVAVNDHVARGQTVGGVGNTGTSMGPHLHFEIKKDGAAQDPIPLLGIMPEGVTSKEEKGYVRQTRRGDYENWLY